MAEQRAKVVFQAIPAYKSRAETMARAAPPEIDFVVVDATLPEDEQIRQCEGAAALIITPNTFSLNILRGCPSVKLVQTISAGYDRIDVKAAGEMGVLVANNGGANAISVAEHALTLMMSVGRHTMTHWHNTVKEGKWRVSIEGPITELTGKTVGIVGLGHIGKQVAKRLTAFDTETIYNDIVSIPPETERELKVRPVEFDQLLRESDIVSVHVPLNRQTRGMISTRELGLMKPTAHLINTCRGPVVDEAALYEASYHRSHHRRRAGRPGRGTNARRQPTVRAGQRGRDATHGRQHSGERSARHQFRHGEHPTDVVRPGA